jgi:hypothetical protein
MFENPLRLSAQDEANFQTEVRSLEAGRTVWQQVKFEADQRLAEQQALAGVSTEISTFSRHLLESAVVLAAAGTIIRKMIPGSIRI